MYYCRLKIFLKLLTILKEQIHFSLKYYEKSLVYYTHMKKKLNVKLNEGHIQKKGLIGDE